MPIQEYEREKTMLKLSPSLHRIASLKNESKKDYVIMAYVHSLLLAYEKKAWGDYNA
jgi:hypothetical protein